MQELIKGQRVLVVGLARSGIAAVKLLAHQGAREIIANDYKKMENITELENIKDVPVTLVTGGHPLELLDQNVALLVKSPGVPPNLDIFQRARSLGIPVISEIELAYSFLRSPLLGVTGTNGKTTTTMLLGEMLKRGGWGNAPVAGNIGLPLCSITEKVTSGDAVAAELSSFQLDDVKDFRPWVGMILNLSEDHVDYHGSVEEYHNAKSKIMMNQSLSDTAVFNADDSKVKPMAEKARGKVLFFSKNKKLPGFCVFQKWVGLFWKGTFSKVCPWDELSLKGEHNLENALAASTAAWSGGVDLESIGWVLRNFSGVEHRLEEVREIGGVKFVNDSKGTNPEAAGKALTSFPEKKVLIAGGKDKGGDFEQLAGQIAQEEIKFLILLGETAPLIAREVEKKGFNDYEQVESLEAGVRKAWERASPGDVVLLSPACASWDMFTDFEERGRLFKEVDWSLEMDE